MTPPAPKPDTTCRLCLGPLISVRDDPHDPQGTTHPGCAPVDRERWDRHDAEQRRAQRREVRQR